MAFLAASLVAEVSGTLMLLIAVAPLVCAVLTSSAFLASSIAALAWLTASETCFFKAAFSSSVNFEFSIASFFF